MTALTDVMQALVGIEEQVEGIKRVYLTQPPGQQVPAFPCIWNLQRLTDSAFLPNAGRWRRYTLSQYFVLGNLTSYSDELARLGLDLEQRWFDVLHAKVLLNGLAGVALASSLRARDDNPQGIGPASAGGSVWFGHVTEFDIDIIDVGVVGP